MAVREGKTLRLVSNLVDQMCTIQRPLWTYWWYIKEGQWWANHGVWWFVRLVPRDLKKWIVVQAAVKAAGDHLNPGEVTSLQMMESLDKEKRNAG